MHQQSRWVARRAPDARFDVPLADAAALGHRECGTIIAGKRNRRCRQPVAPQQAPLPVVGARPQRRHVCQRHAVRDAPLRTPCCLLCICHQLIGQEAAPAAVLIAGIVVRPCRCPQAADVRLGCTARSVCW